MAHLKMRMNNINQSARDKREYRGLVLKNELKVLLISDSSTKTAAASLNVNIGSIIEESTIPGLAHLCERMLPVSSEMYPSEYEYERFLTEHNGSKRHKTCPDHTLYAFDIDSDYLVEALDRFAQFFLRPLFPENGFADEISKIDEEYERDSLDDSKRINQVEIATLKPDHPYNHFTSGNLYTLQTLPKVKRWCIRDKVINFHKKWYSSNIMSLVVLGKEDLNSLEIAVTQLFHKLKNKKVVSPTWLEHPIGPEQMKKMVHIVSTTNNTSELRITFPMPDLKQYYKSKPEQYVIHLLEYDGSGGLPWHLRNQGLIRSLQAQVIYGAKGFSFFTIEFVLTDDGLNQINTITNILFQYIKMIKKEGPKRKMFEELETIYKKRYLYEEKQEPIDYVECMSYSLHDYPMEDVASAMFVMTDFRPDLIAGVLGHMRPYNIRVFATSKIFDFNPKVKERWYGTTYVMNTIPHCTIMKWGDDKICEHLHLPERIHCVPRNIRIYPREEMASKAPVVINETPMCKVWFKQDEFLLPRAEITFEFISPRAYINPSYFTMAYIFSLMYTTTVDESLTYFKSAGFEWDLTNTNDGFVLSVEGYNDKISLLLDKLVEKLRNFSFDDNHFEKSKAKKATMYRIIEKDVEAHCHATRFLESLIWWDTYANSDLLRVVNGITMERMRKFIDNIWPPLYIEGFIHGNFDREAALEVSKCVTDRFTNNVEIPPTISYDTMRLWETELRDGSDFVYEMQFRNKYNQSSTVNYYQCSSTSTEVNVQIDALIILLNDHLNKFIQSKAPILRTARVKVWRSVGRSGLMIVLQDIHHPSVMNELIEKVITDMEDYLNRMSKEDLDSCLKLLIKEREKKPKNLSEATNQLWAELVSQQFLFDRNSREIEMIKTLPKDDLIALYNDLLHPKSDRRRKLSVHASSMAEGGAGLVPNLPDLYDLDE